MKKLFFLFLLTFIFINKTNAAGTCSNSQAVCQSFSMTCYEGQMFPDSDDWQPWLRSGCLKRNNGVMEYEQICYLDCPINYKGDKKPFSCCKTKTAADLCNTNWSEGDYSGTTGSLVDTSDTCTALGGSVLLSDSTGVCCDLHIQENYGDNIRAKEYCLSLSNQQYVTSAKFNSCESEEIELFRVSVTSGSGGLSIYCCANKTENLTFEQICQSVNAGQTYRRYESPGKSGGQWICDEGDSICYEDTANNRACCQENASSDDDQASFDLNLSANNLKFKSLLDMNPLQNSSVFSDPDSRTPGNIINQALTAVVFPIAGVGLIILILWGGFQVLSGSLSGKQNNIDLGKKRVTAAIVGFVLLFLIYWIWRLIALATGLSV